MIKHENYKKEIRTLLGNHVYSNFGGVSPYVKPLFSVLDYLVCQMGMIKRNLENQDDKDYIDRVLDNIPGILNLKSKIRRSRMKKITDIDDCKNCMSINQDFKCDSMNTRYSDPRLNFPCRYWLDRKEFTKDIHGTFYRLIQKHNK